MYLVGVVVLHLTLSIVLGLYPNEQSSPNYFGSLRTTFSMDPKKGFNNEPRLMSEAKKAGWILFADGCNGSHPLPGYHMIQKYDNATGKGGEIALIFDKNGLIAGMRSVNPIVNSTDPDPIYLQSPGFQKEYVLNNGNERYLTTVYFVSPSKVCKGRSSDEFKKQGTGTGLYIVNGSSINDVYQVPSDIPKAKTSSNPKLYFGVCRDNMGQHALLYNILNVNSLKPDCSDVPEYQFLYATSGFYELIGFVFYVPGNPKGKRWEPFSLKPLRAVVGNNYPQCLNEMVEEKGVRRIHVYFRNYNQTCPKNG